MTITYFAGNKLQGVAADTKPTTLPDGSMFFETDTDSNYVSTSGIWTEIFTGSSKIFTPAVSTWFEDIDSRWFTTLGGDGTAQSTSNGLSLVTSATATSFSKLHTFGANANAVNAGNTRFFISIFSKTQGSDYNSYWGTGAVTVSGSSITYTPGHCGFKSIRTSSGTVVTSATNANGTTETATDIGVTDERGEYFMDRTSSTSLKYYRKEFAGTSYVLEATHTTNIPTAADSGLFTVAISNIGVASSSTLKFPNVSFQQEVVL
jgi:hypothetical protein